VVREKRRETYERRDGLVLLGEQPREEKGE
jgi:hypothetical protein